MTPFTLVCVLHDSAGPLRALLDSLARLPVAPQLVAVDAGSRDEGPDLAGEHGAEVVSLAGNPGFGAANNVGVASARHPVCVLLNPDCELLDDGLARLAGSAQGRDALWAPRLVSSSGRPERSAHPVPGTLGALVPALVHPPWLPRAVRERAEPWRSERPRAVGWAVGACLAARTSTLRNLGPFDPTAFLFYEDMDLCLRARAAGVPTLFDPTVRVRHHGAHATRRRYGGEPHRLLAERRSAVVEANCGVGARRRDDLAQGLTFLTRVTARSATGRASARPRAQLRAQLAAARQRG